MFNSFSYSDILIVDNCSKNNVMVVFACIIVNNKHYVFNSKPTKVCHYCQTFFPHMCAFHSCCAFRNSSISINGSAVWSHYDHVLDDLLQSQQINQMMLFFLFLSSQSYLTCMRYL